MQGVDQRVADLGIDGVLGGSLTADVARRIVDVGSRVPSGSGVASAEGGGPPLTAAPFTRRQRSPRTR